MSLRFHLSWNGNLYPPRTGSTVLKTHGPLIYQRSLILSPSSMTLGEHPCDICGEQLLHIGMEKVWQLQHQPSRCCADIFTVSAREVCLREPLCFSWRLVEAYGLSKDAMKPSCRTMQTVRNVTPWKLKQKSIVSTFAKETPRATPTLLTLLPRLTGFCLKLEWASRNPIAILLSARSDTRLLVGGGAIRWT